MQHIIWFEIHQTITRIMFNKLLQLRKLAKLQFIHKRDNENNTIRLHLIVHKKVTSDMFPFKFNFHLLQRSTPCINHLLSYVQYRCIRPESHTHSLVHHTIITLVYFMKESSKYKKRQPTELNNREYLLYKPNIDKRFHYNVLRIHLQNEYCKC